MTEFPKMEDFPMLRKYIELALRLVEAKEPEQVKDISWRMITFVRPAMEEAKIYNQQSNTASRELNEFCDIKRPEEDYQRVYASVNAEPFKRFAIVCEKQGDFNHAIWACQQAISLGLTDDGTKAGMKGRLDKLFKRYNEQCREQKSRH